MKVFNALLFVLYPFAVYYLITRYDTRTAGLFILIILAANYGPRIAKSPETRSIIILQAISIGILIVIAVWINHHIILVHLPVCINFFLLGSFAFTLHNPPSMIERYARPFESDMSEEEVQYCRSVTMVWILFFIFNFLIIESIIIFGTTKWWALYTGLIAYVFMGFVFGIEYVYRKVRFRRFADHFLDRIIKKMIRS